MSNAETEHSRFPRWAHFAAFTLLAALLFALRLAAPPNLLDQDQERPGAYVLDVVKNGHWLCQRDLDGGITSKPPLYTWLSALTGIARGRVDEFALYLPGALAAWGTAWLIFAFGRGHFGARAAFFAALASMLCTAGLKEFGLARTDGVFAFTVAATALLGFRAWTRGQGWTWFWIIAALATLAKGPLGLVLAGGGFIAAFWERKSGEPLGFKGNQLLGIALFLLMTMGWFVLAYHSDGQAFIDKIIGKELVGHTVTDAKSHFPGSLFYQPPLYYLGRGAPWSLFGIYGLWRVWRSPSAETPVRRFERFLFCWFLFGLAIFSLASHQRADLLWPIMPAAALLAGRELDSLSQRAKVLSNVATAAAVALIFGGFVYFYFGPHARSAIVRQTVSLKLIAAQVARYGGPEFPLTHLDDPMGLQIYLNTWRPRVSPEHAADLLRGSIPVFIAVNDLKKLQTARKPDDPPIHVVGPSWDGNSYPCHIVSNVQLLESANSFALGFGDLTVRGSGVRLADATEREFLFEQGPKASEITIVNKSSAPRHVRLRLRGDGPPHREERLLAGHEIWKMKFFGK